MIYSEKCLYFMNRQHYNQNLTLYGLVDADGGVDGDWGLNFV